MADLITDIPVKGKDPSSFRLISTLAVAGFLSGLILVSAYLFTLPIIESNKEKALQEAIYHVLPGCSSFDALVLANGKLEKQAKNGTAHVKRIFAGYDSAGSLIGFAVPASEPGFQDLIKLIYGYEAVGKVIIGFEVLESKETPGLGDKIIKDRAFLENFKALAVEPQIEGAKKGGKTASNQVEMITGATISSKAVIRGLQSSLGEWKTAMQVYADDHQKQQ